MKKAPALSALVADACRGLIIVVFNALLISGKKTQPITDHSIHLREDKDEGNMDSSLLHPQDLSPHECAQGDDHNYLAHRLALGG
ncbi:hypothetical protein [Rouxiella sp. Mn2063]|uniref:hypothetical protein n=1 Tax=Rouxiella sp. Mn2063 TaxID=3395262 RepID=UPI003BC1F3D4